MRGIQSKLFELQGTSHTTRPQQLFMVAVSTADGQPTIHRHGVTAKCIVLTHHRKSQGCQNNCSSLQTIDINRRKGKAKYRVVASLSVFGSVIFFFFCQRMLVPVDLLENNLFSLITLWKGGDCHIYADQFLSIIVQPTSCFTQGCKST